MDGISGEIELGVDKEAVCNALNILIKTTKKPLKTIIETITPDKQKTVERLHGKGLSKEDAHSLSALCVVRSKGGDSIFMGIIADLLR